MSRNEIYTPDARNSRYDVISLIEITEKGIQSGKFSLTSALVRGGQAT